MADLPLMLVYKDGDCWRPVTKDTPKDAELAYLIPNDKLPVSVEFGGFRGKVKRPRMGTHPSE